MIILDHRRCTHKLDWIHHFLMRKVLTTQCISYKGIWYWRWFQRLRKLEKQVDWWSWYYFLCLASRLIPSVLRNCLASPPWLLAPGWFGTKGSIGRRSKGRGGRGQSTYLAGFFLSGGQHGIPDRAMGTLLPPLPAAAGVRLEGLPGTGKKMVSHSLWFSSPLPVLWTGKTKSEATGVSFT